MRLLFPILGYFVWQAFRAGRTASLLEYYPKNIKIEGKKLKDLKLYLVMDVVNPTNKSLDFKAVFAKVIANGEQVGRIEYNKPTTVQALATNTFDIPIILMPTGAGLLISNFLTGKKINLQIDGIITNAAGVQFPFNFNIEK